MRVLLLVCVWLSLSTPLQSQPVGAAAPVASPAVRPAGPAAPPTFKRFNFVAVGVDINTFFGQEDNWYDESKLWMDTFAREVERVYPRGHLEIALGDEVTREHCLAMFARLVREAQDDDISFIYVGSHGSYAAGSPYAFYPYGGAMSGKELAALLKEVRGRLVVFVDTCHAGGLVKDWGKHSASVLVPVCRHDQNAQCWAFSRPFAVGITGSADLDGDGAITLEEIARYCRDQMIDRPKPQSLVLEQVLKSDLRNVVIARPRK
jgi:hypothetical protein